MAATSPPSLRPTPVFQQPAALLREVLALVSAQATELAAACSVLRLDVYAFATAVTQHAATAADVVAHARRCPLLTHLTLTNCAELDLAHFPNLQSLRVTNGYAAGVVEAVGADVALVILNGLEHQKLKDVALEDTCFECLNDLPLRLTSLYIDGGVDCYGRGNYDDYSGGFDLGQMFPDLTQLSLQGRGEENFVHSPGRKLQEVIVWQNFVDIHQLAIDLAGQGATTRFEVHFADTTRRNLPVGPVPKGFTRCSRAGQDYAGFVFVACPGTTHAKVEQWLVDSAARDYDRLR